MPTPQTWGDIAHQGTWISIYRQPKVKGRKTEMFLVVTRDDLMVLEDIRWYAPWRKYVLARRPSTIWEALCLTEVGRRSPSSPQPQNGGV